MSWACLDIKVQMKNLFQCLKNSRPKPSYGFKKKKKKKMDSLVSAVSPIEDQRIYSEKEKRKARSNSSINELELYGFLAESVRKVICLTTLGNWDALVLVVIFESSLHPTLSYCLVRSAGTSRLEVEGKK